VRKLSYTYVKEKIESEGYELLSEDYVNTYTPLKIRCNKGHVYSTPFTVWKRGGRCRYCQHDRLRLDIEFVRSEFIKEGYKLLSTEYHNSRSRLNFICPNGHYHFITWGNWKSGCRCGKCAHNVKFNIDFVRNCFNLEGYMLLTENYINQKQKLKYICPRGHVNVITFSDWRYGNCRCSKCRSLNMCGDRNLNWKGGISCEPYCDVWLDKEFKEDIKKRDNYKCQNPNCLGRTGHAAQLTIHHIDYNKKNCSPSNLITLCRSCNAKANYNRDLHMERYRIIMTDKYKYNYGGI
jgi:hypothetical protein